MEWLSLKQNEECDDIDSVGDNFSSYRWPAREGTSLLNPHFEEGSDQTLWFLPLILVFVPSGERK